MDQSTSHFNPDGDADTVAARAVALLAGGSPDEDDLARVRAWLASSPERKSAFDRARRAWVASREIMPAATTLSAGRAPRFVWGARHAVLGMGAAFAVAFVVFLLPPGSNTMETTFGQVERFELADGTVAWLDGDSALKLGYDDNIRRVELVRGRASFTVGSDPNRPFEVDVQGARVRDIGTEFVINRVDDAATVTVREGIISVDKQGQAIAVHAGQSARWDEDAPPMPAVSTNSSAAFAWQQDKLVFEHTALDQALAEVSRHRRASLWLMDSSLAPRPVSGVIFTTRTEEGLDTLAAAAGVRLVRLPFVTLVFGVRAP